MNRQLTKKKIIDILKLLRRGVRHILFHNGWIKLIALLIALALWAGLISQDPEVTRNKTFQNVSVTVSGADTLKKNGFIVTSNLDELLGSVSLTASVPQLQYDDAEITTYNPRINLANIKSAGEQELKIQYSDSKTYGEVVSVDPASIKVTVEEYFVRPVIPITLKPTGETPEGWYMTDMSVDLKTVSVSGPVSLVKDVYRALVFIDQDTLEWEEGSFRTVGEIKLYNQSGKEISDPQLTISSEGITIDSVLFSATILPTKSFAVEDLIRITGEPAEGYEMTKDPVFSTEYITIAASSDELNQLDSLPAEQRAVKILEDPVLDISDLKATEVFTLKTKKPFEDSAVISSEDVAVNEILVTVEISSVSDEEP